MKKGEVMDTKNSEFIIKDNRLYQYLGDGYEMVIPEGVESVEMDDFQNSIEYINHFDKVVIPGSLKEIPDKFLRDKAIDELIIQEGVEKIGWSSFHSTWIGTLKLPSTIEKIDSYAFYNCGLEKVNLGPKVKLLMGNCFGYNRFSKFVYPKSLWSVDITALSPTYYSPDEALEIVCDFDRIGRISAYQETAPKNPIHFSIIVSNGFSWNQMQLFLDDIKNQLHFLKVQKVTLIGYRNSFYLEKLKKLVSKMRMNIEIEMKKTMEEDLKDDIIESPKEEETLQNIDTNQDSEIETLVQEIKEKSHILEDSIRKSVILQVDDLIKKYQSDLEALRPRLGASENSLKVYQTPQSLRLGLISNLQRINMNFISLDKSIYLKGKIEEYKELVNNDSMIEKQEQVESIEDKIQAIKYYASLMNQENIKDEILKILTEIETRLSVPSLDAITLSFNQSSINHELELESKVDALYQKVKEAYIFYQSLYENNDTPLGSDMKSLTEILYSLDIVNQKAYRERIKQIKDKYLEEVKTLKIERDSERNIREELVPILEDLKELMPNIQERKKVLDDIHEANSTMTGLRKENLTTTIEWLRLILLPVKLGDSDEIYINKVDSLLDKLEDMTFVSPPIKEEKEDEIIHLIVDIRSLLDHSTVNHWANSLTSNLLHGLLDEVILNRLTQDSPLKEAGGKMEGAITSTVRDILALLENPAFDKDVKRQIKISILHILNNSYRHIMNNSFVIEERKDSVTKDLNWSSKAILQILGEFHEIQNFMDETIQYQKEVETLHSEFGGRM